MHVLLEVSQRDGQWTAHASNAALDVRGEGSSRDDALYNLLGNCDQAQRPIVQLAIASSQPSPAAAPPVTLRL